MHNSHWILSLWCTVLKWFSIYFLSEKDCSQSGHLCFFMPKCTLFKWHLRSYRVGYFLLHGCPSIKNSQTNLRSSCIAFKWVFKACSDASLQGNYFKILKNLLISNSKLSIHSIADWTLHLTAMNILLVALNIRFREETFVASFDVTLILTDSFKSERENSKRLLDFNQDYLNYQYVLI